MLIAVFRNKHCGISNFRKLEWFFVPILFNLTKWPLSEESGYID
jgi:hypothetical protein